MIDRANRLVLGLVGLLCLAFGVAGLLAREDVVDLRSPGSIYTDGRDGVLGRPGLWWSIVMAAIAALVVLGVVWARRQLVRRGGSGISTTTLHHGEQGDLTVEAVAVAQAVETDLERLPGVVAGRVRLLELGDTTEVRARLQLARHADVEAVRRGVDSVLERMKRSIGAEHVHARVRLDMAVADGPRVA